MSLGDFIQKYFQNEELIKKIEENIMNNSIDLYQFDDYPIDVTETEDITQDSKELFYDLLIRRIKVLHILNVKHNYKLFNQLSNEINVPDDKESISDDDELVKNIIRIIIIHKILSKRELSAENNELELDSAIQLLKCDSPTSNIQDLPPEHPSAPNINNRVQQTTFEGPRTTCLYCDNPLKNGALQCSICESHTSDNDRDNYSSIDPITSHTESHSDKDEREGLSYESLEYPYQHVTTDSTSNNDSKCNNCEENSGTYGKVIKNNSSAKCNSRWNCEFCMTINSHDLKQCSICSSLAPFVKTWSCALCGTVNDRLVLNCCQCQEIFNSDCDRKFFSIDVNERPDNVRTAGNINVNRDLESIVVGDVESRKKVTSSSKRQFCECTFETKKYDNLCCKICKKCNVVTIKMRLDPLLAEKCQEENIKDIIEVFHRDVVNRINRINGELNSGISEDCSRRKMIEDGDRNDCSGTSYVDGVQVDKRLIYTSEYMNNVGDTMVDTEGSIHGDGSNIKQGMGDEIIERNHQGIPPNKALTTDIASICSREKSGERLRAQPSLSWPMYSSINQSSPISSTKNDTVKSVELEKPKCDSTEE